ncbi:universal stress protein [uncultured Eudoraea sp.]|jgi:nucleotide-binding universal stress UspA family protein|uniref:universal stress protein n=1 Tax=uncultured Eudoraea sp. TaxID=1035614 RepID=UPI002604DC4A|nr:universal stress protein [uncultured Eudoraea sp.]
MKKIILPTDFSYNAYNAISYALNLLKDEKATFYLMNTYTPAIYQTEYLLHSPGQIGLGDIYQSESINQLEELQKKLEKEFKNPKHTIITHSAFNILVDEVAAMVASEEADLVIMGTQGATGAKEIFLGTHTVHVIKKATCPVIAIPADFEYETPKEILFPTDYEVEYSEKQLEGLLYLAKIHNSSIEVIHISSGYDLTEFQLKNKAKLEKILEKIPHKFHDLPNQEIITGINNFQLKNKMNMLAMIQNKHTFLESLFIEPVIKKIGFHVSIPFMVIP